MFHVYGTNYAENTLKQTMSNRFTSSAKGLFLVIGFFSALISSDEIQEFDIKSISAQIVESEEDGILKLTGNVIINSDIVELWSDEATYNKEKQLIKLKNSSNDIKTNNKIIPDLKPKVSFKEFENLNLKIAEIVKATKVKKTKKLMEIEVKLGKETRTVVSGIAKDFNEKDLIGKKVVLLENLFPKKLKGIESNGMILLSQNENGNLIFVGPDENAIETGTIIY